MKPLMLGLVVTAALAHPAMARTVEERLIAGLRDQGYVIGEDGYTFLGRLRIVAESDKYHREIVVNPGTGEVLRDYAVERDDTGSNSVAPAVSSAVVPEVPGTDPVATAVDPVLGAGATGIGAAVTPDPTTGATAGVVTDGTVDGGTVDGGAADDETGTAATLGQTATQPDIVVSEPAVSVEEEAP